MAIFKNTEAPAPATPTPAEIPTLESVSPEFARLTRRLEELNARLHEIDRQVREIHAEAAAQMPRNPQQDRVSALIAAVDYEAPTPARDRLAALGAERRDVSEAVSQLMNSIGEERRQASKTITAMFDAEYRAAAADFFTHLITATKAHNRFGELHRRLRRAGVEPTGQWDFAKELLGPPCDRTNDAAYALRDGAKRGLVDPDVVRELFP